MKEFLFLVDIADVAIAVAVDDGNVVHVEMVFVAPVESIVDKSPCCPKMAAETIKG